MLYVGPQDYNPNTQGAELGRSQVRSHIEIHSDTQSQKAKGRGRISVVKHLPDMHKALSWFSALAETNTIQINRSASGGEE